MAQLRTQFYNFHRNIKLDRFDEEEILREKRDIVLKKLRANLKEQFEDAGLEAPSFSSRDQGSYAMGTGIKPLDGDYDIDISLLFDISKDEYGPVEAKEWVYDAVVGHTDNVELKTSCVTVQYQKDDEPLYHVDLGVFSDRASNADGKSYLAKGRFGSLAQNKYWKESDPQVLEDTLMSQYTGEDKAQYIRCIRYLKRWKDNNFFSASSNGKPSGIALTVAAYNWFCPNFGLAPLTFARQENDLIAVKNLVCSIRNNFFLVWDNETRDYYPRLEVRLPVSPNDDLLSKMSRTQMVYFKGKIDNLLEALESAEAEVDPHVSATYLNSQFGEDFPVPSKDSTAEKRSPAIIGSTSAG